MLRVWGGTGMRGKRKIKSGPDSPLMKPYLFEIFLKNVRYFVWAVQLTEKELNSLFVRG